MQRIPQPLDLRSKISNFCISGRYGKPIGVVVTPLPQLLSQLLVLRPQVCNPLLIAFPTLATFPVFNHISCPPVFAALGIGRSRSQPAYLPARLFGSAGIPCTLAVSVLPTSLILPFYLPALIYFGLIHS
jgi:hypothetical protein